ncbi:MAG: hypothetical protein JNM59_01095 [Hyphomonadaceae bacterium]|nr:hypothetical protein [Hyphomonadaceae bacterium]
MSWRTPVAAILIAACASTRSVEEREPPLPIVMIESALAPVSGHDGGSRAQYLSMLGREDMFEQPALEVCTAMQRAGANVDPVEEIARAAIGRRVVIVNEAHERPQHRAFISDLAARLRHDGFTIYAAETLVPGSTAARPWPLLSDGFYSREPTFGALLRRMRGLDYRFREYDDFSPAPPAEDNDWRASIERRESIQAANIQRILSEDADARLFIHVGHSHVLEQPDTQGNVWMAQRLKEASGIDPLTIDQTRYTSGSDAFVLCDPAQTNTRVDYRIGAPLLIFDNGRPAWRQRQGQRPVSVPSVLLASEFATIVEARLAGEPDAAVPADRLLLHPGETLPLLLSPGHYRIESWTQTHGWSTPVELNVD